jgi:hypothetical protein
MGIRGRFDPVDSCAKRMGIRGRFDPVESCAKRMGIQGRFDPVDSCAKRMEILSAAVDDAALSQVVGGHFDGDLVPGQNTDVVFTHLA